MAFPADFFLPAQSPSGADVNFKKIRFEQFSGVRAIINERLTVSLSSVTLPPPSAHEALVWHYFPEGPLDLSLIQADIPFGNFVNQNLYPGGNIAGVAVGVNVTWNLSAALSFLGMGVGGQFTRFPARLGSAAGGGNFNGSLVCIEHINEPLACANLLKILIRGTSHEWSPDFTQERWTVSAVSIPAGVTTNFYFGGATSGGVIRSVGSAVTDGSSTISSPWIPITYGDPRGPKALAACFTNYPWLYLEP